jgi:hypothetical protein
MLDLNVFAQEVHAVAVEHGWWEGEENNDIDTKIALIHAEWSEALEEYRAERPMVWYRCDEAEDEDGIVCAERACSAWENGDCSICSRDKKPEGIAVELVDGCIRVLDLVAARELDVKATVYSDRKRSTLPQLVAHLHKLTANGGCYLDDWDVEKAAVMLMACIRNVKDWLDVQGVDFEELMRLKHEYNKTRPYRHGGKRC